MTTANVRNVDYWALDVRIQVEPGSLAVPLSLGASTGNISDMNGAQNGQLVLASPSTTLSAGTTLEVGGTGNAYRRWIIETDASAETGSNAGSNLRLRSRADNGNNLHTILTINRQTGQLQFGVGASVDFGDTANTVSGVGTAAVMGVINGLPPAGHLVTATGTASPGVLVDGGLPMMFQNAASGNYNTIGFVTNGQTVALSASQRMNTMAIAAGGTIAGATLTLPNIAGLVDGFVASATCIGTITSLTVANADTATTSGAPTTLTPTAPFSMMLFKGSSSWQKIS